MNKYMKIFKNFGAMNRDSFYNIDDYTAEVDAVELLSWLVTIVHLSP